MGSAFAVGFGLMAVLVFAAAFPIVNPAGSALIFLEITRNFGHDVREHLARKIAFYSFLILNGSLLVGSYVLEFFGISVPALRVAGGIVVAAAAWRLLQEGEDDPAKEETAGQEPSPEQLSGMAFYPFTMPLTTGPGTISVMIALGTSHTSHDPLQHRLEFDLAALLANAVLTLLVYVCFAYADRIRHVLGNTGTGIALRLSAFILLCIGVQILGSGFGEFLGTLKLH
ncbi:MAG TPA: MarC family protein [Rhizomicrobium sp.]|nr:MarC family protein [Rhizomicrobium sp.]